MQSLILNIIVILRVLVVEYLAWVLDASIRILLIVSAQMFGQKDYCNSTTQTARTPVYQNSIDKEQQSNKLVMLAICLEHVFIIYCKICLIPALMLCSASQPFKSWTHPAYNSTVLSTLSESLSQSKHVWRQFIHDVCHHAALAHATLCNYSHSEVLLKSQTSVWYKTWGGAAWCA